MQSFDFLRWKSWLEARAAELQTPNTEAHVGIREGDDIPGCYLELGGARALGSFRCHKQYVDFEVMDRVTDKFTTNKSMIEIGDDNFEMVFHSFLTDFSKVNSCV